MSAHIPAWQPDAQLTLLLHAALDPLPDALTAWAAWSALVPPRTPLTTDALKLLPLAAAHLGDHLPPDDVQRPRIAKVTQRQKQRTLIALGRGAQALRLLHSAGIDTLLLKGAALLTLGLAALETRPMTDVDVLIAPDARERALDLLIGAGWRTPDDVPPSRWPLVHSLDLTHPAGGGLDLHWYALWENCRPGADAAFQAGAVPVTLFETPTRRLNDTDLLLHLLAHGGHVSRVPTQRWPADVVLLLRAQPVIDADRLAAAAAERGLSLQLTAMLAYLEREFPAVPLPPALLPALRRVRPRWGERLENRARMRQTRFWRGGAYHVHQYWRLIDSGHRLTPTGYLRAWWGVPPGTPLLAEVRRRG